jgi:hypothetical protein
LLSLRKFPEAIANLTKALAIFEEHKHTGDAAACKKDLDAANMKLSESDGLKNQIAGSIADGDAFVAESRIPQAAACFQKALDCAISCGDDGEVGRCRKLQEQYNQKLKAFKMKAHATLVKGNNFATLAGIEAGNDNFDKAHTLFTAARGCYAEVFDDEKVASMDKCLQDVEEACKVAAGIKQDKDLARASFSAGCLAMQQHDLVIAREKLEEAKFMCAEVGNGEFEARVDLKLGELEALERVSAMRSLAMTSLAAAPDVAVRASNLASSGQADSNGVIVHVDTVSGSNGFEAIATGNCVDDAREAAEYFWKLDSRSVIGSGSARLLDSLDDILPTAHVNMLGLDNQRHEVPMARNMHCESGKWVDLVVTESALAEDGDQSHVKRITPNHKHQTPTLNS